MGQRILYLPIFFSFLRVGVYFPHTPDLPTLSGAISDILIIFQLTGNHWDIKYKFQLNNTIPKLQLRW